jgi:hypothetical protein
MSGNFDVLSLLRTVGKFQLNLSMKVNERLFLKVEG